MTERSKKLFRQYKRYLGNENAENELSKLASAVRENNHEEIASFPIEILEKFPSFVDAVEKSYSEYESRLYIAARNIELSSEELTTALHDVEELNLNINTMLNSLGQGLLFFDRNGICSSIHSRSAIDLLGSNPSGRNLAEVIDLSEDPEIFHRWLSLLFSDSTALSFDDIKAFLPSEFENHKGRYIEFDYKPMYHPDNDKLIGVLLIATDVTYRREAEKGFQRLQQKNIKMMEIASDRYGFLDFVARLKNTICMLKEQDDLDTIMREKDKIMRQLHTCKGLAGLYSLIEVVDCIHSAESAFAKVSSGTDLPELIMVVDDLENSLDEDVSVASSLFGCGFLEKGRVRDVSLSTLEQLKSNIASIVNDKDAQDTLISFLDEEIIKRPIFEGFIPFRREIIHLTEQQGKPVPTVEIFGDNISVLPGKFDAFFQNLTHVARNIADHAIEHPPERECAGKPLQGRVSVKCSLIAIDNASYMEIEIKDDGEGIDPDKIRNKLLDELGDMSAAEMSDEEIINTVFKPGFSLKSEVSLLSGRGTGMDALKDAIVNLEGSVTVASDYKNRKGTTLIVNLPLDQ